MEGVDSRPNVPIQYSNEFEAKSFRQFVKVGNASEKAITFPELLIKELLRW